jgi:uncharacterized Zn-binding protein involved in type VI secretion
VFIGGSSAWRAGDEHFCPLTTGNVAHKGGAVRKGSTTVFINKKRAARAGDLIVEVGVPNPIAAGCPTVLIGG